jgi:hypothetical protein
MIGSSTMSHDNRGAATICYGIELGTIAVIGEPLHCALLASGSLSRNEWPNRPLVVRVCFVGFKPRRLGAFVPGGEVVFLFRRELIDLHVH